MASTDSPTPREILAAATKLASQSGAALYDIEEIINMIDQIHHRFVDGITPNVGEQEKAAFSAEQKREALRIQLVSMKQGVIGLAVRSDSALQFQDYMWKTDDEPEGHSRAVLTQELQRTAIHKGPDQRKEHLAQGGKRNNTPHTSVIGSGA